MAESRHKGVPAALVNAFQRRQAELEIHNKALRRAEKEAVEAREEALKLTRELEEKLRERAAELDAFVYSVSHELREPSRYIEGFTKALIEDYADSLDTTGRDYINRIRDASLRMSALLSAILDMARFSSWQLNYGDVDLTSLVGSVARELHRSAPQQNVTFVIARGVTVKGDAEMLRVVVENLLHNALKFTKKHPSAKIEFGTMTRKGRIVYFVRDDGIGFDMAYAESLFLPFHRLHPRASSPGIGTGLAVAKRIIERHGGDIWVESAPGKGATFYFSLSDVQGV